MGPVTLCWCTCGVCYLAETARCLCGCVDGAGDIVLVLCGCVDGAGDIVLVLCGCVDGAGDIVLVYMWYVLPC